MEAIFAVLVGWLAAISVYLMLSGALTRFLFGLVIVGNAVNLLIFAAGRPIRSAPPILPEGLPPPEGLANALPQALILTAIVIGFGLQAFAFVLAYRAGQEFATEDTDAMRAAEPPTRKPTPPAPDDQRTPA